MARKNVAIEETVCEKDTTKRKTPIFALSSSTDLPCQRHLVKNLIRLTGGLEGSNDPTSVQRSGGHFEMVLLKSGRDLPDVVANEIISAAGAHLHPQSHSLKTNFHAMQ